MIFFFVASEGEISYRSRNFIALLAAFFVLLSVRNRMRFLCYFRYRHLTYYFYLIIFSARIFVACMLQVAGFLLVALANSEWIAILGVIATSFSSGIGEASLLAYSSQYHK